MALPGLPQITTDLSRAVVPVSVVLLVGISVKAAFVSSLMAAFHGAGLMSIRGFFGSDDEEDEGGDGGEEGGMVFDESVDDMDDGGLGGFDDMDDGWGDDGGGEGSVGELENRVDEIENELASVSSTVSTVKSENEEISDSVDEIEDNVRKLLDIYEMVTRGVNPFVDDAQQGGAFDDGSFGLFNDDDGGESSQADEDLDDDIVNAEAESFFDDDFEGEDDFEGGEDLEGGGGDPFDDGGDDFGGGDFDDDFDGDEFGDDPFEDGDDGGENDDGSGGTGKSFDELKSEYDSGDAEWAGEGEEPEESAREEPEEPDDEFDEGDSFDAEDPFDADEDQSQETFEAEVESSDDAFEDVGSSVDDAFGDVEPEPETDDFGDVESEPEEDNSEPATETMANQHHAEAATTETEPSNDEDQWESPGEEPSADAMAVPSSERPYLTDLQNGYVADMVVMEWLTYLVEEGDAIEAHRAIKYYEDVEWISESVADRLWDFLDGFPHDGPEDVLPPREDMSYPSELTVDHHIRSLSFIANLAGDQQRELFDRWNHRGEPNAIQH